MSAQLDRFVAFSSDVTAFTGFQLLHQIPL